MEATTIPANVEIRRMSGVHGTHSDLWRDPESGHLMMLHSEEADPGFVEWACVADLPEVGEVSRIARQLEATFADTLAD